MSHTPAQRALAVAIAQREKARTDLELYIQRLSALELAEQEAEQAEADTQAALMEATATKIRTGTDTTNTARTAYQSAVTAVAVAEVEHAAAEQVVTEQKAELDRAEKAASRAAVEVAKQVAAEHEPALIAAARAYGAALAKHRALIRFSRKASADSGLIADPISDWSNSNNPLKLKAEQLINSAEVDGLSEQHMLDAKLNGGAA